MSRLTKIVRIETARDHPGRRPHFVGHIKPLFKDCGQPWEIPIRLNKERGQRFVYRLIARENLNPVDAEIAHRRFDRPGAQLVFGAEHMSPRGRIAPVANLAGIGRGGRRVLRIDLREF